jgi:Fe-S-cluster-containing dehydrogenase component
MNRCVGCQACVIACQIENHADQNEPWRSVHTSNSFQHPQLPIFYVSLACNHCETPVCRESCPADAYTVDQTTHTIDHHPDRCIGCRYCTWACPYDAPKFISSRGVVEKCTLCKERVVEGRKPNCANLCPTGALDFGEIDDSEKIMVPGFIDKGLRPGIRITPLRSKRFPSPHPEPLSEREIKLFRDLERPKEAKVQFSEEWPLVVFTVVASLLFGIIAASAVRPLSLHPIAFLATGIAGILLSVVHLGRKPRAWRALLNVRSSWLSREVAAYGLFLAASGFFFFAVHEEWMRLAAVLAGLATLVSIDKVYTISENRTGPGLCSASTLLTGLLFFSLLSNITRLFILITGIKLAWYSRELVQAEYRSPARISISAVRICVGFLLPLLLGEGLQAGLAVLIAELINRSEFYADLQILTPRKQIGYDLLKSF